MFKLIESVPVSLAVCLRACAIVIIRFFWKADQNSESVYNRLAMWSIIKAGHKIHALLFLEARMSVRRKKSKLKGHKLQM